LDYFRIPYTWFTKPILAGTVLGPVRDLPELKGVTAVAVPGHDTACAYAAMPTKPGGGDLFISSGTWSLVGFESDHPVLGPKALKSRISNERCGDGHYRPLTNVIGLWLLEQTLKDLSARPKNSREWKKLINDSGRLPAPAHLLDVEDPAFINPPSMRLAIDAQLKKRRLPVPRNVAGYTRLICDSLGQAHATADASGLPVHAFTLEGSAVGNIASQLVALRAVRSLASFRELFARQLSPTIYLARPK
jgi:rhamnulokinase